MRNNLEYKAKDSHALIYNYSPRARVQNNLSDFYWILGDFSTFLWVLKVEITKRVQVFLRFLSNDLPLKIQVTT